MQKIDAQMFRLMAEQTQDYAIFLLDREGHVMSWNLGAARIKGYAAAEIIGRHFSVFYTAEDITRQWPQSELRRATLEGRFEDEGWRVKNDGSRFWANVVITALRDESGQLLGFSKITRDLTLRKQREEDLRQSEEHFRLLVDGVSDYAIYMLSPEGIVNSWNLGARRIKGYEASEIIGKHFSRFYDAEGIAAGLPWNELAVAREHGRAEDEGWRVRKDGTRFWARVVVTALHDTAGRLRGFAKVTQDLTQRRHSEALEDASRKLNEFISVLAHELRNPLAPIRNAVSLWQRLPPSGDAARETIERIVDRQSAQLARLVDDLLDIGRVTRGTLEIRPVPTALHQVVNRAVEAARPAIEASGHVLELDLPESPVLVNGDEVRLTQALTNILNNAGRYSDKGSRITVRVYTAPAPASAPGAATAMIAVRDTGHGIAPELLGAIFGMFVQGRSPYKGAGTGLGIGLALTRSIVELHHGTVEASSEGVGKGSEFIISLPLAGAVKPVEAPAQEPPPPSAESRAAVHAAQHVHRILVVDDNADAADILSSILKTYGHEIQTVNDGVAALQMFEEFRPDVVLMDIGMPGMNGLEVARRMRERNRNPRPLIVAVTGWGKPEDEVLSHAAGFDAHLMKPVNEDRILTLLESPSKWVH